MILHLLDTGSDVNAIFNGAVVIKFTQMHAQQVRLQGYCGYVLHGRTPSARIELSFFVFILFSGRSSTLVLRGQVERECADAQTFSHGLSCEFLSCEFKFCREVVVIVGKELVDEGLILILGPGGLHFRHAGWRTRLGLLVEGS